MRTSQGNPILGAQPPHAAPTDETERVRAGRKPNAQLLRTARPTAEHAHM